MDKVTSRLKYADSNSKGEASKYEMEAICNNTVYAKMSERGQLPAVYYLILWKGYLEEKNT